MKKTKVFFENYENGILLGLITLVVIARLFLAQSVHPMQDSFQSGPELDGYVKKIISVVQGDFYVDPFRPLLYSIFGAGFVFLGASPFLAGQCASFLGLAILLFSIFKISRFYLNQFWSYVVMIPILLSYVVVIAASRVATDTLFAGFACLSIWLSLEIFRNKSLKNIAFCAAALGLCYSTRYTTLFLLPLSLLPIILFNSKRLKHLAIFSLVFIVVSLPQMAINYWNFENPFYNENYKNIGYHIFAKYHPEYTTFIDFFTRYDKATLTADIKNYPDEIVHSTARTLSEIVAISSQFFGLYLNLFFLLGVGLAIFKKEKQALYLLIFPVVYILGIAVTFEPLERLFIFPIAIGSFFIVKGIAYILELSLIKKYLVWPILIVAAYKLFYLIFPVSKQSQMFLVGLYGCLAIATIIILAKFINNRNLNQFVAFPVALFIAYRCYNFNSSRVTIFIDHQPIAEYKILKNLEKKSTERANVIGVIPFGEDHFNFNYTMFPAQEDTDNTDAKKILEQLANSIKENQSAYLIVGPYMMYGYPTPASLLANMNLEPWGLELIEQAANDKAKLYQIKPL